MRAMRVHELGQPMQMDEVEIPQPGPKQVSIDVAVCGVNFADTLIVHGKYQEKPDLPFAPGAEICGRIRAVGEGVKHLQVGMRVSALIGSGGFAEVALADARTCIPVPDGMSDAHAAAFTIVYGTSHVALDHRARLQAGENLLVLGAAGGVGLTAIEIGKLMGANVIACARGAAKLEIARQAGADHLIDSDDGDLREQVKALGGADVVYDPVGGDLFKQAMRACNPEARLIPLGFASGDIPQIPANILLVKNLTVLGVYWGAYSNFKPEVLMNSGQTLFNWYLAGKLKPHVSHELPLEQATQALDLLITRKATGKVVVKI
ncbi:NADPH2:quinone reductase [Monaibacterium marinum]|uniref:NADPH2:quinone reductase n=1 Tax=Pontivivens marinum TaxID=1690039 RepID=A0A2C9CM23_9RHOB|nr:NADPH:quinone oxidoreductase family protein [Monaibacterium marinum]SOH92313.1 NADPH2:quinone reductase [Monaibacterium marinum]